MVDIDGTLTVETEGWGDEVYADRTPIHHRIQKVNELHAEGHTIIIWTSRFKSDRSVTEEWLERYGVRYDCLRMGKPQFDILIDDKVILAEEIHNVEDHLQQRKNAKQT